MDNILIFTSVIEGIYTKPEDAEKLKNFIIDYYTNNKTLECPFPDLPDHAKEYEAYTKFVNELSEDDYDIYLKHFGL